ncbi:DUF362 domain-containing protein [Candidatus Margulisiibacteriota bacterium]
MIKKLILFMCLLVILSASCRAGEKSVVVIAKVDKEIASAVADALRSAGDLSLKVERWNRVILKASVDEPRKDSKGYVTSPEVLRELIRISKKRRARRVTIAEGVVGGDSYTAFNQAGYTAMAKKEGAILNSLDSGRSWRSWVPDGSSYKKYFTAAEILNCEVFINVPVLKYDETSKVSLALKNTMGVIYGKGRKKGYFKSKDLDEVIVDLNMIRPSDIVVIDGTTVVLEDGKTKKDLGIIIVSSDPVAADAVGARIMGFDPMDIRHLVIAERKGLGNADLKNIKVVGERIDKVQKLLKE